MVDKEMPNMFRSMAIVTIPVKDQDASKAFYTSILGCKVLEEMPMGPEARWIRLEIPGVETKLVLATWFPQMRPGGVQGLVLSTEDIAKTHTELKRRGLAVSDIQERPYGLEATFDDLDGNGWVLLQPAARP